MKNSLKQERRILFAVWAVAVVAGVAGGPFLATVTGQPWVFFGLLVLAVLLGFWHSSFRRRSQRP
ncbi:hypothetical protein GCM10017710_34070 [Arthrobacter ramosus]